MKRVAVFLIIIMILPLTMNAQPNFQWIELYHTQESIFHNDVFYTIDEGFAICGKINTGGFIDSGADQFFIRKTDENGATEWTGIYGPELERDWANSLVETDDGGFFAGGVSYVEREWMVAAVLTNEDGEEQWFRRLRRGTCNAVIELKSGEFLLAGRFNNDGLALCVNSEGRILWERTYEGPGASDFRAIRETNEGYLFAGITDQDNDRQKDFWLVRTDDEGEEIWQNAYDDSLADDKLGGLVSCEGGFMLGGHNAGEDCFLGIKIDGDGNVIWKRRYFINPASGLFCTAITSAPADGFCLVGGATIFNEYPGAAGVRISAQGEEIWQRVDHLGREGCIDSYKSATTTEDGSIIATGSTLDPEWDSYWDGFLVKLEVDLTPPVIVDHLPDSLNLVVLVGDSVEFSVQARDAQNDQIWYMWLFEGDTVSVDSFVTVHFDEPGEFQVICNVGDRYQSTSIGWNISARTLYIDSISPGSANLSIKRNESVDFSFGVRTNLEGEKHYGWTYIDRLSRRHELPGDSLLSLTFTEAGDCRVEGGVLIDEYSDYISWEINVYSSIWSWYPEELNLTVPIDTSMFFHLEAYDPHSDSLSYQWFFNDEAIEVDSIVAELFLDFPETGDKTITGIVRDGVDTDTIRWEIQVFDPNNFVTSSENLPGSIMLSAPIPNPFNSAAKINFTLPSPSEVSLNVFDLGGRRLVTLLNVSYPSGSHCASLNAEFLPAGVYILALKVNDDLLIEKAVVMK